MSNPAAHSIAPPRADTDQAAVPSATLATTPETGITPVNSPARSAPSVTTPRYQRTNAVAVVRCVGSIVLSSDAASNVKADSHRTNPTAYGTATSGADVAPWTRTIPPA